MDKIIKKYCPTCGDYKDCPYRLRNLERDCPRLSDIAYGYELAEKDFVLTWEDIEEILIIDAELWEEIREQKCLIETKEYYGEVLRRFNEYKSKKNESNKKI